MRNIIQRANFDFMGKRRSAMILSGVLVTVALVTILIRGLNFGVDFTGGYTIEVGYPQAADLNSVRSALQESEFPYAEVQTFGTSRDVLIRMAPKEGIDGAKLSQEVIDTLSAVAGEQVEMRRVEFVGPQVGAELREKGGIAILVALFFIVVYIWFRFEKKFSVGSVLALIHDVLITVGIFALFQIEFDLSVLAAILAVIGYSLNDTIVVFDRIRENFRTMRKGTPETIVNTSVNQTLSRTVITSLTTLLVLLSLYVFGGQIISGFALALIIGVVVGTHSSIFVASTAALHLGITKEDLMPITKEGAELDEVP
ncbi:MAG: protein translocase subunit SecF [Gammaproteobacteria bacterium]|nr:protein translocase subunit SecF [Gammaproteobacteria bacterium]